MTVFVHKFEQNGLKMLLDANSGAFHIVDDLIYDIVDSYGVLTSDEIIRTFSGKYKGEDLTDGIEELNALKEDGLLFTKDPYEDIDVKNDNEYIKAMCLNIAHDCNLRCKYCFASKGDYNGLRSLMSEEVGKASIDFVIQKSGPRKNIEIDLFGGEPLMNFKTVKSVVDYGQKRGREAGKNIRFTITTNATLLSDEIIDYIDKNMGNVVLSIDGRKSVNDNVRVRCDGTGTYDTILPQIKKMVERRTPGKQYYVRGTFTANNLDFYNDVIELADLGFKEISIEPVVLPEDDELCLKEENIGIIFEQYDKLTEEIIKRKKEGRPFKFYHFNIDVSGGPCIYKRIAGCGAGHEYVAVTPEGDIYPCHQFVGNDSFKMGTVFDGELNQDIIQRFSNATIYQKDECKKCWARFYCSGGCQANNYNFNGSILKPYKFGCKLQKKRIECALAIKAIESLEND